MYHSKWWDVSDFNYVMIIKTSGASSINKEAVDGSLSHVPASSFWHPPGLVTKKIIQN